MRGMRYSPRGRSGGHTSCCVSSPISNRRRILCRPTEALHGLSFHHPSFCYVIHAEDHLLTMPLLARDLLPVLRLVGDNTASPAEWFGRSRGRLGHLALPPFPTFSFCTVIRTAKDPSSLVFPLGRTEITSRCSCYICSEKDSNGWNSKSTNTSKYTSSNLAMGNAIRVGVDTLCAALLPCVYL